MPRIPVIAVPTMGLDPDNPTKVLPGLEACKSPNPSSLKNGCMGTAPSIGMDHFGLWCASGSSGGLRVLQALRIPAADLACLLNNPCPSMRVL